MEGRGLRTVILPLLGGLAQFWDAVDLRVEAHNVPSIEFLALFDE